MIAIELENEADIEKIAKIVNSKPRKPELRILPEWKCEILIEKRKPCDYCVVGGEGYPIPPNDYMTADEIVTMARILAPYTSKRITISGGEPLLRSDICDIISQLVNLRLFKRIRLVTRSRRLKVLAPKLKEAGLNEIAVSIDQVSVKSNHLSDLIEGLYVCARLGFKKLTINSVISRSNISEVPLLIKLAAKTGARLALLNLMDLHIGRNNWDPFEWMNKYVPLADSRVANYLKKNSKSIEIVFYKGLIAPQIRYQLRNGVEVFVWDSRVGTYYSEYCNRCIFYPCQNGLFAMRLTHGGYLKTCVFRNDDLVYILQYLRSGDFSSLHQLLKEYMSRYENAKWIPKGWTPKKQLEVYRRLKRFNINKYFAEIINRSDKFEITSVTKRICVSS